MCTHMTSAVAVLSACILSVFAVSEGRRLAPGNGSDVLRACLAALEPSKAPAFPEDGHSYDAARRTFNGWALRTPAAVFFADDADDVRRAVQCAGAAGYKVTPASGRQSYSGDAVINDYLVIDVSALSDLAIINNSTTMKVGPGVSGGVLQSFLYDNGLHGAGVVSGGCTWVGLAGFALGGGLSPVGRYLGLACDHLAAVEIVVYNGTLIRATRDEHPDLLWASCGGGGGTFGVVTSMEFKINALPNDGLLTIIEARYKRSRATTLEMFMRLQRWLPDMDRRFSVPELSLGTGTSGHGLWFSAIFLGTLDEAVEGLSAAGMLDELDDTYPVSAKRSDVAGRYPHGLEMQGNRTIYDYYFRSAPVFTSLAYNVSTPWPVEASTWYDTRYTDTPEEHDYLTRLLHGKGPQGQVVGGPLYNLGFMYSQSRMTRFIDNSTLNAVLDVVEAAHASCLRLAEPSEQPRFRAGCTLATLVDVLGGAYADKATSDTAFPHRDKWFVLACQSGVPSFLMSIFGPEEVTSAVALVDAFARAIEPFGSTGHTAAYVNYMHSSDAQFDVWQHAYFGDNYPRLLQIKEKYDPTGIFTKRMTVGASQHKRSQKRAES